MGHDVACRLVIRFSYYLLLDVLLLFVTLDKGILKKNTSKNLLKTVEMVIAMME